MKIAARMMLGFCALWAAAVGCSDASSAGSPEEADAASGDGDASQIGSDSGDIVDDHPRGDAGTADVASGDGSTPTGQLPKTPPVGATWQWQLTGKVDTSLDVQMYDIDGFDATPALVAELHKAGRFVTCYLDLGSAENYRPDYGDFAASALSNPNPDWPDESWIDIKRLDAKGPTDKTVRDVLLARIDMCKAKGFDAVEPDMIEVHAASGVTWTPADTVSGADQLVFNRWIAKAVHDRGMRVALKGDSEQAADLAGDFDFDIQEQCYETSSCSLLMPFIEAGKPVFEAEYSVALDSTVCQDAKKRGFSVIKKNLALDKPRTACP